MLSLAAILLTILPAPAPAEEDFPSITAWPLVWHRTSEGETLTDVLWPVFQKKRRGEWERVAVRPFLYSLETDPSRDLRRLDVLWPLSRFEREGEREKDYIFPIYWRGHAEGREWFHLWPFYGSSLKADGTHTLSTLHPLFRYSRNEKSDAFSLDAPWPLFNRFRREGAEGGRFLPFYWRHKTAAADGGLLFPYLWYETPEVRRQAIFPLWYRSQTADSRLSLLLPLYFGQQKGESSRQLLFPLWYRSRDPDTSTSLVLPFWLSHRWKENRFRIIFPLNLQQEDVDSELSVWLPVYFHYLDREAQSDLVYYFPVYGRYTLRERVTRHLFFFPLSAHYVDVEKDHRSWNVLWPLFHYETAPEFYQAWALPLYWHSRSPSAERRMVLGLFWSFRREDAGSTWLFPLYAHLYSPGREQRHIPLVYSTFRRDDGYRKSLFLGPLYITTEDPESERRQTDLLWPLISRKKKGEESHSRVLPFYWHTRRPGEEFSLGSLALLPPYYLKEETAERSMLHLWPFFGKTRNGTYEEISTLWPLFRWGDDPQGERGTRQFLLAYSLENGQVRRSGFFPLWHRRQEPGRRKTISLLHWNEEAEAKDFSRFAILHLGHPDYSLFSRKRDGQTSRHRLFPFYSFTRNDKESNRRLSILGPVYSRRWGPDHSRTRVLWKTLYSEYRPQKEERGLLWRLVRFYRDGEREIFEVNPIYYREKKADGEEFRSWIGGLYAIRKRGEEREQHRLFWALKW